MPKRRFKDFDDMLAESLGETVTIRVYGRDYTIPAQIPAIVPVMMARHEDDPAMLQKAAMLAADLLFGPGVVDEWTRHPGFTQRRLETILMETFRLIHGAPEPEERIEDDAEREAGRRPK